MAVLRSNNWLGQQRVDVPHLRAVESSLCADFDVLAGNIIAGLQPVVVSGFDTITTGAVGQPATNLQINVANAIVMHTKATDSGTFLQVSSTRAAETLNSTNTRVKGGFTSSSTNYIGIDLVRTADTTTADLVQFLNPVTDIESPKDVPLGRTFDYVIYISTQDFSATPNVCPLAIVTTDASNNVSAITDARNMLYRLGSGGSNPNPLFTYAWPGGRTELGTNADFSAADKKIGSQKDWMNSIMTRLWEVGGGEHWYSNTGWHNVHLLRNGTSVFVSTGDYFEWTGTNLHWKSLRVVFSNSTGWFNDIADQLTDSPGLTDLADGQCIYVDLDRTTNRTGGTALTVLKGTTATLGSPLIPGSRMIVAWRIGSNIFTRGNSYYIGATFNVATTSVVGVVKLHQASLTPATPVVLSDGDLGTANGCAALNANRAIVQTVVAASNSAAITGTGDGTGSGGVFVGGSNGVGVFAQGNNTREGINSTGGSTGVGGAGVIAAGGGTAGIGVQGTGAGTGPGVKGIGLTSASGVVGTGGPTAGIGGDFSGGTGGIGVRGTGTGVGQGADFVGGSSAPGIVARGTLGNANAIVRPVRSDGKVGAVTDYLGFRSGPVIEKTYNWWGFPVINNAVATNTVDGWIANSTSAHGIFQYSFNGPWVVEPVTIEVTNVAVAGDVTSLGSWGSLFYGSTNGANVICVVEWTMAFGVTTPNTVAGPDYFIGFTGNTTPGESIFPTTNCAGIRFQQSATDSTLIFMSNNGGASSTVNTTLSATTSTIRRCRLEWHGSGSPYGLCVRLFIDGTLYGPITTNVYNPATGVGFLFEVKSNGGGSVNTLEIGPLRYSVLTAALTTDI